LSSTFREQADLMSGLIEEVLDVQRVQLGKLPLEISRFDLVQLARGVAEEIARLNPSQAIQVIVSEPPAHVHADRGQGDRDPPVDPIGSVLTRSGG
jgi:signal transduction histidine kinase